MIKPGQAQHSRDVFGTRVTAIARDQYPLDVLVLAWGEPVGEQIAMVLPR
jgi:hypothetical protein